MYTNKKLNVLPLFLYRTNTRTTSFHFTEKDISLIKNLDQAKAHGYDNISVKMVKICSEPLTAPLRKIFKQSLTEVRFPEI